MPKPTQDVNPVEDSSSSSPIEDVNTPTPSSKSAKQTIEAPSTLAEVIKNTFQDSLPESDSPKSDSDTPPDEDPSSPDEESTEDVPKTEPSEDEDSSEDAVEPSDQAEEKAQETVEKGPVPYKRFVEVNEVKTQLEQEVATLKPQAEAYNSIAAHLTQNNVSPESFYFWMDVATAMEGNPERGLELLKPYIEQLAVAKGDVLPVELQKAVDDGEINLDWAKKLAQSEQITKLKAKQTQSTQAQLESQKALQTRAQMSQTLNAWDTAKRALDPDFKPKSSSSKLDGKYEFFLAKYNQSANQAKSVQDLVTIADQVYDDVDKAIRQFIPVNRKTGVKVKSISSSSAQNKSNPQTLSEVIRNTARTHGLAV